MFYAVDLKVLFIVHPILLVVIWIQPGNEVPWLVIGAIRFVHFSESSLAHFKSVFFHSSCLHIPIFKCSLVRPSSCISRGNYIFKSLREIIHLKRKSRHAVHVILEFRRGCLTPHLFRRLVSAAIKKYPGVPVAMDVKLLFSLLSILDKYRAFKFECLVRKPTSALKLYCAFFIWPTKICDS